MNQPQGQSINGLGRESLNECESFEILEKHKQPGVKFSKTADKMAEI